jgi:hypothetical protein
VGAKWEAASPQRLRPYSLECVKVVFSKDCPQEPPGIQPCLSKAKNGHVADTLDASKSVRWFSHVLALRRHDNCKPAVRWWRKAYGLPLREVAGLSNGGSGATKLRPQRGEGATLRQT